MFAKPTVFVALSGGVDSAVAAAILQKHSYRIVGVFMKNWSDELDGCCNTDADLSDARAVAVKLQIPFYVWDFEKAYRAKVMDRFFTDYQTGRTPNPDIWCNQEIKFKLFLQTALDDGADFVATGHYARVIGPTYHRQRGKKDSNPAVIGSTYHMLMARDQNKDQTYFLYRITKEALQKTIFPLGELTKPAVRELAEKNNLVTAKKKESMGICFVGKVPIKDFLSQFIKTKAGKIIDQSGVTIGEHDGAIFYTIGQRHGLEVGGGLPLYVTGKNMGKNEVYVTTDLQDEKL